MTLFRRALGVRSEFQKGTLDVSQAFFDEVNLPLTTPYQPNSISRLLAVTYYWLEISTRFFGSGGF